MTKVIRTIGSVVVEPITWRDKNGDIIESFMSEIPQGSTAYKPPSEGGKCITFAAMENGDINGSEYEAMPKGAKRLYIPDLKNLKKIYFV